MTQLKSDSPIQKRQIVNLQIIDEDVASAAGIVTSKLADGALFIKSDGTVDFAADQDHGGYKIINVGAPVSDTDAVRLIDLQTAQAGQIPKEAARVATTPADGNQTLTGLLTIDSVTVSAGNRVLIKNQTDASENGIYVADSGAWSRSADANAADELVAGSSVFILEGTVNAYTSWTQSTTGTIVVDTTDLVWVQGYAALQIVAGAGMTRTSNTIDVIGTTNRILVNADSVDISPNYVGQTSITTLGTIATGVWSGTPIANNKLANSAITISLGTAGTDIGISGSPVSLGGTVTINVPSSSATNRGLLTASDWSAFNAKQPALGYTPITNVLTDSYILVGNVSNVATPVAISGQATISNAGAITLSNAAIIAKILTGYTATSGVISAADTILSSIQKLGFDKHVPVTLKVGSQSYIELSGQEINATTINIGASYVTGTISSTVLGGSTLYVGTTAIALNRASLPQALTGITSIDGTASAWTTPRLLAGNSVSGTSNVPFNNKFIVQGTVDAGLTGAQFLGALGTGLVKNTTTTGVLSIITDNSANWDSAYNNTIVSAAFGTSTGLITLTQQDAGTVTANLDGRYLLRVGSLLNDEWFTSYDYAGNIAYLFKMDKDNILQLGPEIGIRTLYAPTNSGRVNFAKMPIALTAAGQEMSLGIAIGTRNQFRVVGITNSSGGLSDDYVWITSRLQLDTISHETTDVDKFIVSNAGNIKYRTGTELLSDIGAQAQLNGTGWVKMSGTVVSYSSSLSLLNSEWLSTFDYAGNVANLIRLSKDNVIEFGAPVAIDSLYHVINPGVNDIVDISISSDSANGAEHGVGISVAGSRILKVSALSDGAGAITNKLLTIDGTILAQANASSGAYDLLVRKQSDGSFEKIASTTFDKYNYWQLRVNTGAASNITTLGIVDLKSTTGISLSQTGNDITIGNSGVLSFNTRTGAVSLTGTDVESVLTGNITSHTHTYQTPLNFYTFQSSSSKISVNSTAGGSVASSVLAAISIDVVEANLTHDNIGGTLSVNKGGTGATTLSGVLFGNGTAALSALSGTGYLKFNGSAISYDSSTFLTGSGTAGQLAYWGSPSALTSNGGFTVNTTYGSVGIGDTAGSNSKLAIHLAGIETYYAILATDASSNILIAVDNGSAGANKTWVNGVKVIGTNSDLYVVLAGGGVTPISSISAPAGVLVDGDFTSQGIMLRGASPGSYSILTDNSANWNTAYSNRISTFTTTGTSGAATFSGNTLNIPTYQGGITGVGALYGTGTSVGAVALTAGQVMRRNLTNTGYEAFIPASGTISKLAQFISTNSVGDSIVTISGTESLLISTNYAVGGNGSNLFIGTSAPSLTSGGVYKGSYNTSLGRGAMEANTSGGGNVGVGCLALQYNTTTDLNTAIGYNAIGGMYTGGYNVAIGAASGASYGGGYTNSNAYGSLYIGALSYPLTSGGSNEIVVGFNTTGNGSNTATWGNSTITSHYFSGNLRLSSNTSKIYLGASLGYGTAGQALLSGGEGGGAYWGTVSGGGGGGSGTVTSIAMSVPTGLTVSPVTAITTAGTFEITLTSGYVIPQTAYQILNDNAATKVSTIVTLTQSAYNALSPKVATTMYVIVG